jgi:hypothetical protein
MDTVSLVSVGVGATVSCICAPLVYLLVKRYMNAVFAFILSAGCSLMLTMIVLICLLIMRII